MTTPSRRTPIVRTTLPASLRALAAEHFLDLAALLRAAVVTELRARGVCVPAELEASPRQGRPPGSTRVSPEKSA